MTIELTNRRLMIVIWLSTGQTLSVGVCQLGGGCTHDGKEATGALFSQDLAWGWGGEEPQEDSPTRDAHG